MTAGTFAGGAAAGGAGARSRAACAEAEEARLAGVPRAGALAVSPGDAVFVGQELCVVEAMKMQNVLTASRDGVVKELLAPAGTTLAADQPIILFEQDEAATAAGAA